MAVTFPSRRAFISVGAVCQQLGFGGRWSVLRRGAAGRVDSSLRSHRTWWSYCRYVYSGLNKTLFASVGPNSHCRGHRQTLPAKPESPGKAATFIASFQENCLSGRINASRGHRRDVTHSLAWRARKLPPHPSPRNSSFLRDVFRKLFSLGEPVLLTNSRSLDGLLRSLFVGCSRLVQSGGAVDRLLTAVLFLIPHHRVQRAQEPASHRHVGLGLADSADESLPNGFLPGIALAEGDRCLAQGPTQSGRAGLGDVPALRAAGRFLEVRGQSRPELQSVAVGEAIEGADLSGDDQAPDVTDPGNRLQQELRLSERFAARGQLHLPPQFLPLALDEQDVVQVVAEGLLLNGLEQVTLREEPSLGARAVELRSAEVGRMEHRLH